MEGLNKLRRSLIGSVITPTDAGNDSARRCFNALIDRRPAVIARCVRPDDVGTAFDFAGTHELEVAWGLRGGGDNFGGATRLRLRLHPLERVVGGLFEFRGERGVREALRRFRDLAGSPRDHTRQAEASVDESLSPTLIISPCYTGSQPDTTELRALRSASVIPPADADGS
jgi:hypothetical protein